MVVVGKKGWAYNGVREQVNKLGMEKDIIFLDYVEDDDLVLLYNAASLFIMPSLYEGFGLPVLEAMACGTPVVASNVSSVPEVMKDAGILVDPYDTDSICDGMFRVLTDDKLQEELREKSLKRATFFSWEKTARSVLSEYETLMAC
jgi:glycosyltransferase involved in cell wall biosynthesis